MTHKPLVYVETTVISLLTAREPKNELTVSHQKLTRAWWDYAQSAFDLCISEAVLDEIGRGDQHAAQSRMDAIAGIRVLPLLPEEFSLASEYIQRLHLPLSAALDASHIASASLNGADYLVTWNCRHIANAQFRQKIAAINSFHGYPIPVVCTPEELFDARDD